MNREAAEFLKGSREREFSVDLTPMLLESTIQPFVKEGWIFEPKLDGMRCLAFVNQGRARLVSRQGRDITNVFPMLASEISNQPTGVYDGEITALDEDNWVSFERLRQRWNLRNKRAVQLADKVNQAYFHCFDLLYLRSRCLLEVELALRKEALNAVFERTAHAQLVNSYEDGETLFEVSKRQKYEGIVAKDLRSEYKCGLRTSAWQKIKYLSTDTFIIVGHREGEGFLLSKGDRVVGCVASGISEENYRQLKALLLPTSQQVIKGRKLIRYRPRVMVSCEFMERTSNGMLRFPVFKGIVEPL